MQKLSKKDKKHLKETAKEFLKTVQERVDQLVFIEDVDGLGRLVEQVEILGGYEVIKVLKDKGLSKDITALCDKAGRISLSKTKDIEGNK